MLGTDNPNADQQIEFGGSGAERDDRSLDTNGAEYGPILANPSKPFHETSEDHFKETHRLERCCQADDPCCQSTQPQAVGGRDVEKMVQSSNQETIPLCTDYSSFQRMRPSLLVRTLNAAGLGKVLSDRQLRRYRAQAGYRIGDGRTVDLLRLTAWLVTERHSRLLLPNGANASNSAECTEVVSVAQVERLLQQQGFRCALTGYELEPDNASLDHILAVSRGGPHTIENAQILRKDVNRAKGTMTNEEFIVLCRAVVRHADKASPQSTKEYQ